MYAALAPRRKAGKRVGAAAQEGDDSGPGTSSGEGVPCAPSPQAEVVAKKRKKRKKKKNQRSDGAVGIDLGYDTPQSNDGRQEAWTVVPPDQGTGGPAVCAAPIAAAAARPPSVLVLGCGAPCVGKTTVLRAVSLMHPDEVAHATREAAPDDEVFARGVAARLVGYQTGVTQQRVVLADGCHHTAAARAKAISSIVAMMGRDAVPPTVLAVDFAASGAEALERFTSRLVKPARGKAKPPPPGLSEEAVGPVLAAHAAATEPAREDEPALRKARVLRFDPLTPAQVKVEAVLAALRSMCGGPAEAAAAMPADEALGATLLRTSLLGRGGWSLGQGAPAALPEAAAARFDKLVFPKGTCEYLRHRAACDLQRGAPLLEKQDFHVTLAYYLTQDLDERGRAEMTARLGEWAVCRVLALVQDPRCACYAVEVLPRPGAPPLPRPAGKRYHITLTTHGVKPVYSNTLLDAAAAAVRAARPDVPDTDVFTRPFAGGDGITVTPLSVTLDGYVARVGSAGRDAVEPFHTGCGLPPWAWEVPEFCTAATRVCGSDAVRRYCRAGAT